MTYESANTLAQIIALILFLALFVGVIVYVYWPGNKQKFENAARLPLDDEKNDEPDGDRS